MFDYDVILFMYSNINKSKESEMVHSAKYDSEDFMEIAFKHVLLNFNKSHQRQRDVWDRDAKF